MTFRDDHDATLARADALERELDDAQEELEETREEMLAQARERERVEAENAALREEIERARRSQRPPAAAPPKPPKPAPAPIEVRLAPRRRAAPVEPPRRFTTPPGANDWKRDLVIVTLVVLLIGVPCIGALLVLVL